MYDTYTVHTERLLSLDNYNKYNNYWVLCSNIWKIPHSVYEKVRKKRLESLIYLKIPELK